MAVLDKGKLQGLERARELPCCTLAELRAKQIESPRELVSGLICEGETVLIAGRPKAGKSRLTQQLARDLSRGEPFLGHAIPQPRRVLILDLENRPAVVRERFLKMAPEPGDSDENISIYAAESLSSDPIGLEGDGFENLVRLIDKTNPDVIIIDTWRLLMGGTDENKAEEVVKGLRKLSELRKERPQLVTIIVHHLRKQNSDQRTTLRNDPYGWVENVSGHHALVGHVDACYGIERESAANGEELIVFGGVARNAASTCTLLDEDEETLTYSVANGHDALRILLTPVEHRICEVARSLGERFTFSKLVSASNTKNKKAVSSTLRKAESHGVLQKVTDLKGTAYVWL